MDIGGRRIVYLVIIVSIVVYCVASDSQFCRIQERPNMGLSKIQDPAQILSVGYEFQSASDCYDACCNYTENQCNAVSFYDNEKLCMLLNCRPFRNCVWVNADGFVAARIQMTSVADDAQPPPPSLPIPPSTNDPMASSMTSQQPMGLTTSQALVEQVTSAPTTTQITATTTPSTSKGLETSSTQALDPDTSSNSVQAPASFDSTNSSEAFDWNMNNEDKLSEEVTPIGLLTTAKSDSSQQTTAPTVQGDYSIDNQTDDSINNTLEADDPLLNTDNGSISDEEWNVDASAFFLSDDRSRSGQASKASTKGLTDDQNMSETRGGTSTEEPWNIDSSFFSNNDGQHNNGQPNDLSSEQNGNGQPTGSNNGQADNRQPTDVSNGQNGNEQPTDVNSGKTDSGQTTDLSNGQTDKRQPNDLNEGQTDNGQPTYNNNGNEPSFEDPWIVDSWSLSNTDDTGNNGQALDSNNNNNNNNNNGPQDNGQTDNVKEDFAFTDGSLSPTTNYNEFTTRSNAGDGKQPDDQQQHFDDMLDSQSLDEWESPNLNAPLPSNPASESSLVEPVFLSNEGEGSNGRPREMKRMLIHSPGIIIGLCSAFGVAFLVLLAVARKIYLSQDRPRYKPLRDYDIRFEPPAASSALLP